MWSVNNDHKNEALFSEFLNKWTKNQTIYETYQPASNRLDISRIYGRQCSTHNHTFYFFFIGPNLIEERLLQ